MANKINNINYLHALRRLAHNFPTVNPTPLPHATLRFGYVSYRGHSGKGMLDLGFSQSDPNGGSKATAPHHRFLPPFFVARGPPTKPQPPSPIGSNPCTPTPLTPPPPTPPPPLPTPPYPHHAA